jgi:hypothetical protein
MSLPFGGPQCFFIVILVFIVLGFQHGWRRGLVSLVFVLLASVLINANTSDNVSSFLGRIPVVFALIMNSPAPESGTSTTSFLAGPVWSLIIFAGIVVLGYYVGMKAFPAKPANPQERFIGIIPSVLSGAFILGYLSKYVETVQGQPTLVLDLSSTDPVNYVPVIFVIAILALIVALISARVKKAR